MPYQGGWSGEVAGTSCAHYPPGLSPGRRRFTAPGDDALVFTGPAVTLLEHANFRRRVWRKATEAAGLYDVHFHDLRHTGNMLSAEAGATLRELMDRMGHSSTRAALVYLHATSQ